MEHIAELVHGRKSVRTFAASPIHAEELEKLTAFFLQSKNPFDIPVEFRLLSTEEHGLSSPVVSGAAWYRLETSP